MRVRPAALLTPPSATPAFLQNVAKSCICHTSENSPVTPIIATDPKKRSCKSCVCHTCDPLPPSISSPSPLPSLATSHSPLPSSLARGCKFAPLSSSSCSMLPPQPFSFHAFAWLPGGGWVTSAGPPLPASSRTPSVLTNVRCRTMRPIVNGSSPVYVYVTVQLQRTARQYAWHAEPGSPAGVPYAGGRAAQRGKPLQERPCS